MAEKICQNVLVVVDDQQLTRLLLETLARKGIRGTVASRAADAMGEIDTRRWDLILADLKVLAGERSEFLQKAKANYPELPIIVFAEEGLASAAIGAIRQGCDDCLVKPIGKDALERLVDALLPNHDVALAASAQESTHCLYQIAGKSPRLLHTIHLAQKAAPTSVPILVTGESGTGKELIAYLIHHSSKRGRGPYIQVNCAALSDSLLESELFGHERGAFTGAHSQRKGRFERAHGGTLLLDEISETSSRLQAKLLRVLEQQDFERVGGNEMIRTSVRVLATSNRDLTAEVQKGRFRDDLYYRLCGVHLVLPTLRERREDIPLLVWHFVNLYAHEVGRRVERLAPEMLELFDRYDWPGNVRQLRNVVRSSLILGDGAVLSLSGTENLQTQLIAGRTGASSLSLQEVERHTILEALQRTKSNQAKAARLLGITDRTLREKLKRYRREEEQSPAGEKRWELKPA